MVAAGRADIMADPVLNPWDLLPLIPILEGAGAKVTDWRGRDPLDGSPMNGAAGIVVAPPHQHPGVLANLNEPSRACRSVPLLSSIPIRRSTSTT